MHDTKSILRQPRVLTFDRAGVEPGLEEHGSDLQLEGILVLRRPGFPIQDVGSSIPNYHQIDATSKPYAFPPVIARLAVFIDPYFQLDSKRLPGHTLRPRVIMKAVKRLGERFPLRVLGWERLLDPQAVFHGEVDGVALLRRLRLDIRVCFGDVPVERGVRAIEVLVEHAERAHEGLGVVVHSSTFLARATAAGKSFSSNSVNLARSLSKLT